MIHSYIIKDTILARLSDGTTKEFDNIEDLDRWRRRLNSPADKHLWDYPEANEALNEFTWKELKNE